MENHRKMEYITVLGHSFATKAFFLLGIERFLYGYWFILPNRFKAAVRNGTFGTRLKAEPLYWKVAMRLGMYIKISATLGLACIAVGQGLNYSVFKALGAIGVYYGYEFGYTVPRVSSFPYNTRLSDPQYWGVVICIWGIYLTVGASSFVVPWLETFWYVTSMKVLESDRGRKLAQFFGIKDVSSRE